ncbi:MAG: type VI secretion system ImpA family N-terminal domain-containing protein [Parachlamydia sp.]|nr:type VI secretion system ImpA family N-terminal domain-containing protein [Parachlamydia sp.]
MTTLDLLQQTLNNPSPTEDLNLQTHFDKIVQCIEREKMDEAADMIEKIFAKGTPDIRLIAYYLFAHFCDQGLKSFADIFPLLSTIFTEHWDTLLPSSRKEKQVENSLTWLIVQLISKLKYVQKVAKAGTPHPIWDEALEMSPDEHDQAIGAVTAFKDFFYEKWPKSPSKERVMHLVHLTEEFKSLSIAQTAAEPEIEEEPELKEEPIEEKIEPLVVEEPEPFFMPSETVEEAVIENPAVEDAGDYQISCENLHLLADKLKLFDQLICKQDWNKASIVAKDIDHLLENFDPLVYFPKLLSRYFAISAKNVAAISEQRQNQDTQFIYLEKLYKTDIAQFIEW